MTTHVDVHGPDEAITVLTLDRPERRNALDHATLGELIEDVGIVSPADTTAKALMSEEANRVLDCALTPREAKVLRLRFGIGVRRDHTLEEVGTVFSLTRERIRQIEAQALRKLRRANETESLRAHFEQLPG